MSYEIRIRISVKNEGNSKRFSDIQKVSFLRIDRSMSEGIELEKPYEIDTIDNEIKKLLKNLVFIEEEKK